MDLWEACYPDIPLENRVSREWKRMGFQRYYRGKRKKRKKKEK